ncbi:hypothetical protein BDW59DRAFT_156818 [Aspergillus cavernicola]|uniref:Uncharacterized protein n=1 Tax=Aspergillus cavernicola TaxID=176166 RepID=A0ABR4IZW8_9EURO
MSSQAEPIPAQGSESDNHQILWPTIFFWMVCFALNSTSQPTGRVLGLPYRHPSILRSSPIICAFDAINILTSWVTHVVSPIAKPASFRHSATRILLHRVVNKEGNPDIQAIKNIKAQSRVRWALFLLGTVPQFIKLFTSRGIPWSQAIGAIYLASWLLFEILVLSAMLDDNTVQSIKTLSRPGEEVYLQTA